MPGSLAEVDLLNFISAQYNLQAMQGVNIIQMNRRYPFDKKPSSGPTVVKLRRKFSQFEYQKLREKVQSHSKLNHPSLISICKGFQSKKNKYFDMFFEYVPCSLKGSLNKITLVELFQIKQTLLSLCIFLLRKAVHPLVNEEVLGCSEGKLKYYLDVDYSTSTGSLEELIRAKELEINSVFGTLEQTLHAGSHMVMSQNLLFRNKGQSMIQNIPKLSTCLNPPRLINSIQFAEPKEAVRMATQESLPHNISHKTPEYLKLLSLTKSLGSHEMFLHTHPYVSSQQSLIHGKVDAQEQQVMNRIVNQGQDGEDHSTQLTKMFEEVVIIPKGHIYEQFIQMKCCQSEIEMRSIEITPEGTWKHNLTYQEFSESYKSKRRPENNQMPYKLVVAQQKQPMKEDKRQKKPLYCSELDSNEHLIKDFNTLFETEYIIPNQINDSKQLAETKKREAAHSNPSTYMDMNEFKKAWAKKQRPDVNDISNRVKKALQKSEETLSHFRRFEKFKK